MKTKSLLVLTISILLINVIGFSPIEASLLDNMDFNNDLLGWEIGLYDNIGTWDVDWSSEYGGSAQLFISGSPAAIDISQTTKIDMHPGDSITVDLYHTDMGNFSHWNLRVDGEEILIAQIKPASNETQTWIVDDFYPTGTQIRFAAAVWPGSSTTWLKEISYEYESVPIPSAIWLFGTGLIGLKGFRRKLRKYNQNQIRKHI